MQREQFEVLAAGRRLAALRLTPAERRGNGTLIFLHEGLGCIGFWKDVPELLSSALGLRALVYDRWGYGASEPFDRPRQARYLHDEAEIALPDILDALGIDEPILIGHSDGGSIALLFASAHPGRTRAIVAIAAHVFVEELTLEGIRRAAADWAEGSLRRTLERYHAEKAPSVFANWADCWLSPDFRDWNIEACLPRITAPVLVIQGSDDEHGTIAQVEAIAGGIAGPAETCWIDGCRHVPHHQAREATLAAITGFIERHAELQGRRHRPARPVQACTSPAKSL